MSVLASALLVVASLRCRQRRRYLATLSALEPSGLGVHVLSLGTTCLTARLLGDVGARAFAAPFDWIFSSPAIVSTVLADGGSTLLDPSMYFRATADGKVGHYLLSPLLPKPPGRLSARGIIFNHHDPLGRQEDHAYLERAVARLRLTLASPCAKLFVVLAIQGRTPVVKEEVESLLHGLAAVSNCAASTELVVINIKLGSAQPPCARLTGTLTIGHAMLRSLDFCCFGGLGPSGVTLEDEGDRAALLAAIFASHPGMLDSLDRLAPDPLQGAAWHPSTSGVARASQSTWVAGRAGGDRKYADDGYLTAARGIFTARRRKTTSGAGARPNPLRHTRATDTQQSAEHDNDSAGQRRT